MAARDGTIGRRLGPGGRARLLPSGTGTFFRRRLIEISGLAVFGLAVAILIACLTFDAADPSFNRAVNGEFDVVLAIYHDQGHIAIKVHDFHHSTTATLGIPFIRTSVDHGTAFDIAGKGIADHRGLIAAIDAAKALSRGQLESL